MILGTIFEMLGAITVGARTADTIKNGIIPNEGFQGNASVQLLAFACASAGASTWVMWCTRNSAHVSSTYSLISSLAGVGIATVGPRGVQWGWNGGKGLGAIFAGLAMAPACSAVAGALIFSLIKYVVHVRKNPVPWAVWTSPFFFLIAGTICTLSIVYKGSPRLGLADKPAWFIASVTLGVGIGLFILSAIFFVPFVHAKVIKKDPTLRIYDIFQGPLLFKREAPEGASEARVPNYAVVQHDDEDDEAVSTAVDNIEPKKRENNSSDNDANPRPVASDNANAETGMNLAQYNQADYKELVKRNEARFHAKLRKKRGPLGWAMRTCHANQYGPGAIYEKHNMIIFFRRIPAMIVVALLYGVSYDIHAAQTGITGTPEGIRMERVYDKAKKYPNEVEHLYSFVQIITACTASFAHGANDVGNAVGPWAAMYAAWSTSRPTEGEAPVPLWQLAVMSGTISVGLITYGYNIMKGKPTSRSLTLYVANSQKLWVTRSPTTPPAVGPRWRWAPLSPSSSSRSTRSPCRRRCASLVLQLESVSATVPSGLSTGSVLDSWFSPGS